MAVNKVVYSGDTLIDLTGDTVTAADVAEGVRFHLPDGNQSTGTAKSVNIKMWEIEVSEDKTSYAVISGANEFLAALRNDTNAFVMMRYLGVTASTAELAFWLVTNFPLAYNGNDIRNSIIARSSASAVSSGFNKNGLKGDNYNGHLNVSANGSLYLWPSASFPLKAGKYQVIAGTIA